MKRTTLLCAVAACLSLTCLGAFVSSSALLSAADSPVGDANTYVHYLGRSASKGQNGIREYWIRCGGGYQFTAPSNGTVVEGGIEPDTSGFASDDPRWIFSVTLEDPQYINVCDSYSKKVDFLDNTLNTYMTAVSVTATVGSTEYDLSNAGRYLACPMPQALQDDKAHHGANEIVFDGCCQGKYYRYYIPVIFVTAEISSRSMSDLLAVTKCDGTESIEGYYTISADIKQANLAQQEQSYFASHYAANASSPAFRGTLDGRGNTINVYRSYVYSCGLFGTLSNATVKNLNVNVVDVVYPWDGGNVFACNAFGSTFDSVSVTFNKAYSTSWTYNPGRGALLGGNVSDCSFRNVGVTLKDEVNSLIFLYGSNLAESNAFENCTITIPYSTQMSAVAFRNKTALTDSDIDGLTLTSTLDVDYKDERDAARAFTLGQFGSVLSFQNDSYPDPSEAPSSSHPRVLINSSEAESLRSTVSSSAKGQEDYFTITEYQNLAAKDVTGVYDDAELSALGLNAWKLLGVIEAKALSYLLTGDRAVGYRAIRCIKNYLLTLDFSSITSDLCRAYGQVMYVAAEVYDWCYDLLNSEDKTEIVAGVTSILAPHFEMVASSSDITPTKQSPFTTHGGEAQLLRDWLSFAIAVYDEYPAYFHYVSGRLTQQFRAGTATLLGDALHWEGSAYGQYRMFFLLLAQKLYKAMNTSGYSLFDDAQLEKACVTMLGHVRPDGQLWRDGDDYNEKGSSYSVDGLAKNCFLAGNAFGNTTLKGYAYDHKWFSASTNFSYNDSSLTPVLYLTVNDKSVGKTSLSSLSPVTYSGDAQGYLTAQAKSAGSSSYDIGISFDMAENFTGGHQHLDAGSFQIYYKGMLASDSGYYDDWGTAHWYSYAMQTVAHNSLLLYNPNHGDQGKYVYSGGQRIDSDFVSAGLLYDQDDIESFAGYGAGTILGRYTETGDSGFTCAYLAGDLTGYYDSDTAEEVSRYLVSATTSDASHPLVTLVYDRITTDSANYKKTFLLHTQSEPTLNGSEINVDNGSGSLHVESLGDSVSASKVEGCSVNGNLVAPSGSVGSIAEVGWGRAELTPSNPAATNRLLTALTAQNSGSDSVAAAKISGSGVIGASILGNAFLFPQNGDSFASGLSTTVSGSGAMVYLIAGLPSGTYQIENNGVTAQADVPAGQNFLRYSGQAGSISLVKAA